MIARLTADTQRDLLRGIAWFEKISTGLGDQFELNSTVHWIGLRATRICSLLIIQVIGLVV